MVITLPLNFTLPAHEIQIQQSENNGAEITVITEYNMIIHRTLYQRA